MAVPHRSERDIIAACLSGDPDAAVAFVALHQDALARVASRLVGRWGVTEDVVQETFVRAFERMDRMDASRGALGWLLKTTLNICRDYLRQSGRRELPDEVRERDRPLLVNETPNPESEVAERELAARLAAALWHLSSKLREVVVLHHIEGLPLAEVARAVGAPVAACKVRVMRARIQLRALLAQEIA